MVVLIVTYASIAVFMGAVVARFVKLSRLPVHLRWELYPVAHEGGARAKYGGSYLEEPDWWTKPREASKTGQLRVMVPEILFLHGVWEHNRPQWARTFPFHFGLYMLAGLIGLLILGAALSLLGVEIGVLQTLTAVVGWAGLVLLLVGASALLGRRLLNEDYREYTTGVDFFNLGFFAVTALVGVLAHAFADPVFLGLRAYVAQLITFGLAEGQVAFSGAGVLLAAEIVLASLLLAYIPLTHMAHFFTKWFMYHDIRWGDEPNLRGGKLEERIGEALKYPVSWSAPHIRGDGKRNWVDVATSPVKEEQAKEGEAQ